MRPIGSTPKDYYNTVKTSQDPDNPLCEPCNRNAQRLRRVAKIQGSDLDPSPEELAVLVLVVDRVGLAEARPVAQILGIIPAHI